MRTRVEGVTDRLLACARAEFLEKGFQDASMRSIAKSAETSPRAIYTRFSNKKDLFLAIIGPVTQEFQQILENAYTYTALGQHPKQYDFSTEKGFIDLMDYIYDHLDEFKLLITCSEGTEYHDFISWIVDMDTNHEANSEVRNKKNLSGFNLILQRLLTKNFYTSLFEPVVTSLSREEAKLYVEGLYKFYIQGVQGIL